MDLRSLVSLRHHRVPCLVMALLALLACSRPHDNVPVVQKTAPIAAEAPGAPTPQGFALASARAEQYQGQLAIVLEFTQPLVGTQAFDTLIAVNDAKGGAGRGQLGARRRCARPCASRT